MLRRIFLFVAILPFTFLPTAGAQTPEALPYTMTTIGGLSPMTAATATQCPNLPTGVVSTDAFGDGCLAVNGIFGAGERGGVAADSFGNVFVDDDVKGVVHTINLASGRMTALTGGSSAACAGKEDSSGDGCNAATGTAPVTGTRGIGIDPYGNVLLAGYNDHFIHIICRTSSPLCGSGTPSASNPILIPIGNIGLVAGCAATTTGNGTNGAGVDNTPAFSINGNALTAFNNSGTCSTSLGEVDQPRGVTGDVYGNVYFGDTASYRFRVVLGPQTYNGVTNPLWAILENNWGTPTAGYVYTVATGNNASTPASGAACGSGTSTDAYGDGCLFTYASLSEGSSSFVQGLAVDAAGNMIFSDPSHGLRVLFVSDGTDAGLPAAAVTAGEKMKAVLALEGVSSPVRGDVYMLAGGGSTTISSTPTLGTSTSISSETSAFKVTVSAQGNIFIGDSGKILFFDINTGYIRTLFTSAANVAAGSFCNGSSGQVSLSAYSDGCPASESSFANSNGLGVAADGQGNLYLLDATSLPRKILAQGFAGQTLGTALTQTFETHFYGASAATATVTNSSNGDVSGYTTPTCTLNADNTADCLVSATVTPTAAGRRSASMTVANASSGSAITVGLGGTVTGSVLAIDDASAGGTGIAPTTSTVFSTITPAAVALDGAGNVYAASGTNLLESIGGTTYTLTSSLPATPSQIAVDATGNVFAVASGNATITELEVTAAGTPSTYATTSVSYTPTSGTAAPQAIAVDRAGNLYVADYQSGGSSIYEISLMGGVAKQATVASGLNNPVSLAVDYLGDVFVADKGAGAVYKLTPDGTGNYVQGTVASVTAASVAVDAAGDVYVQNGSAVTEFAVSGPSAGVPVLTGLVTPVGLAVDGLGNVYSADANNTSITKVARDNISYDFGTSLTTAYDATLTNIGNQASTGQNTTNGSDTTNFVVTGGASNGCAFSSNVMGALASGTACTLSAELFGSGSSTVNDLISFEPSTSTAGVLTLTGTLQGVSYPTTSTIGTPGGSLTYSFTGTEASITITVDASGAPSAPTGYVNVYVDSTTSYTQSALTAGSGTSSTATVNLTGLAAGNHTIAVVYPTTGQFVGSGSVNTTTGFTIAQASTTTSWTPGTTTKQVSAAVGTDVLDATATTSDATATNFTGSFAYTVTPSGGSAEPVDASSYLPIGSYSLAVTFTPADSVDYASSTATVASFTVTQASTTASVGASTNVVAADGTGNYTSLSAALAALPTTGGTLYLKPGTYYGQNAISYPNVQLRGLGGDPTKVVLTAEDGAFSSPFTGYLGTGSGAGNANASGDQGSSTLDVTKSAYMGTTQNGATYVPNNFYAEYLTIQNTYNTDTSTTSTYNTISSGGTCTGGQAAQTLQALYNGGIECSSQALALWIESDQAILNNVNLTSQQDTLYAGSQGCGSYCTAARQYMWKGTITGDVDYVFGDAALVFDHTNFFTTWHGNSATGTETIEAQNKKDQTGSSSDYLSGYVCNSCTLLSQSPGMTNLYYGRPYGAYSTWIMLNSYVDQVNPAGWLAWSGTNNLQTSTYAEYNTQAYTDPAVGVAPYPAGLFYEDSNVIPGFVGTAGYTLTPAGGNSGSGATSFSSREITSTDPGTSEAANVNPTQLTAEQAAQYYPVNFLGATVSANTLSAGQSATWNPVTALANMVNSFAPTGNVTLSTYGESVTILGRPQTPGAGIIPTGSYAFYDSMSGATCTAAGGSCTTLASGTLDASGEAYLTTSTLAAGTHTITMTYGGDANFTGSTSSTFTITVPSPTLTATTSTLTVTNASSTYGGTITGTVTVTPTSGTGTPTGTVTLMSGATVLGSCTLSGGSCSYTLSDVAAGSQTMTASYGGDGTFASGTSNGVAFSVAKAVLTVTPANATMAVGGPLPTFTYGITGFVNSDSSTSGAVSGAPVLSTTATTASSEGQYPITAAIGTLAANNYSFSFATGTLTVTGTAAVATGDSRTVTEPSFPSVCQALTAAIAEVSNDIPASVDATNSNPDGARIQAALNSCSTNHPGEAVELSADSTGAYNAFLSGPLTMPANVTLLVDPGVTLFFSRNAQDYDKVSGTHTCGTVNGNTATNSCLPLIDIPKTSTNVGIMGYGKLDGRGEDALLNGFASSGYTAPASYTWWNLASQANTDNANQQNPRFIQLESGGSNMTMYKITLLNAPMFHISTTGSFTGFTAWDIKIVTPTSARNTDGIDPGNAQNFTITKSWISDGDDNVAVGASGSSPAKNISVTDNHFYAGHGESIGSYTSGGVSNVLFDGNMLAGNGYASHGSSVNATADGNSTGIRIKSANDRGGVVTNIQYSNSCFLDHSTSIQFTPFYEGTSTTGSETPNFENILLQNLIFENDDSKSGSVQFTGAVNSSTTNPLTATLDNVTFPSALSASTFVTTGTKGTETNAELTYGPGDVSSNFVTAWGSFAGSNGDTATNNITASSLNPPSCDFTYLAPELTGPTGLPQTIEQGQTATAVVILTPTVGGAAYPTGTVTLTDALTSNTYQGTLSGSGDTLSIPLSGLSVGTHTFSATYTGDSNYTIPAADQTFGSYVVTVNAATLPSTTTALSGVPSTTTYGTSIPAVATVTGTNPTGTVQFIVNGSVYTTVTLTTGATTGTASTSISLDPSGTAYSIYAVYSGDSANAGSTSSTSTVTVSQAAQTITFAPSVTTYPFTSGGTFSLSATSDSGLTVSFASTTGSVCTVSGTTVTLATAGTCTIQATQAGNTDYAAATPVSVNFTISPIAQTITFAPSVTTYPFTSGGTFSLSATSDSGLTVSFASTTGSVCTVSGTTATMVTAGTCTIQATQAGNTDYAAATPVSVNFTISQIAQTITFAPSVTSYPYTSGGTFSLSATSSSGLTVSFASTTGSVCTVTGTTATMVAPGTCTIQATQAGNTDYAAASPVSVNFTIGQLMPAITLSSGTNPALVQNAVVFTATVTSASGTPTGTVNFLSGSTLLGTGTLNAGVATFSTSSLPIGSSSITAVYQGDATFGVVTSAAITESVVDINVGTATGGTTETVSPGGTATIDVPVAPSSGTTFPVALTLTVAGLPSGATTSVTPSAWVKATGTTWTLPANTALSGNTVLSVVLPATAAALQPVSGPSGKPTIAPFALALLLLPFAGLMRRTGKQLAKKLSVLLLLAAGMASLAGLSGCASNIKYTQTTSQSYNVTVTVSAGSLSRSTAVTLTVQ